MIGEYISPDGVLRFVVTAPDGDLTMGFDGYPSHTHGDVLAALAAKSETPEDATRRYLSDLISNRLIIAIATTGGQIRDIWITDDPDGDLRHCPADEVIVFRRWDGAELSPSSVSPASVVQIDGQQRVDKPVGRLWTKPL